MISRGVPHTTAGLRAAGRPHPPWGAHFHLRLQLKICKTSTLLLLIECQKIKSLLCIPSVGWHGHHFPHHSTSSTASCSQKMNPKQQDAGMLHSPAPVQYPTHLVETGAPHSTTHFLQAACWEKGGRAPLSSWSLPGQPDWLNRAQAGILPPQGLLGQVTGGWG